MKNKFVLLLISLFVFSCQKQQFKLTQNNSIGEMKSNADYEEWDHQFLWGFVPTSKHDVYQICGGRGAEYIQTQQSFVTGLLTSLTYGLYNPRVYKIQCVAK